METEIPKLHMFFFPFMAKGHIIPIVDIAKLFVARGVKITAITTQADAPFFSKANQRINNSATQIDIKIIKFPSKEVGLPEGCENVDAITNSARFNFDLVIKFFQAAALLQEPLEDLLEKYKPDCLVADMFFPWATDAAAKFGIPRLVFHGTGFFSLCTMSSMRLYEPHKKVSSDSEEFVVPNLPDEIKLSRKQIPDSMRDGESFVGKLFKAMGASELKSYGVVVNSFYELEPAYAEHFRKVLGRRAWHIGPVSLCNRSLEDLSSRGKQASLDEQECLKWLNSKEPNSVVYVCFGSVANFSSAQLMEIALGLEASGQSFIWVVRKDKKGEEEEEDWLPVGFEKKMEGRGLIIRGWAPQLLILDHEAVGGFVTHCGWNSTLEGVSAGVPMVAWPVSADQFYNEKLITQVLKIGVSVGIQQSTMLFGDYIKKEAVEKAVRALFTSDEAKEMRSRAKALGEMAKKAVEEGGSSYSDLSALIEGLMSLRHH